MTDGLYMYVNVYWWMSSNQHIGQTKIGLLGKITGARVMVSLPPLRKYESVCRGCVYRVKIHILYTESDISFYYILTMDYIGKSH